MGTWLHVKKCSIQSWWWLAQIRHSTPKYAPNIFSMDMLSVKWLQKNCFFILLFTSIYICISDIYSRLDNVNTSLNIVTESLLPFEQAFCKNYFDVQPIQPQHCLLLLYMCTVWEPASAGPTSCLKSVKYTSSTFALFANVPSHSRYNFHYF